MRLHAVEADPIDEIGLTDTEFTARTGRDSVEDAVNDRVRAGAMLLESTTRIHRRLRG